MIFIDIDMPDCCAKCPLFDDRYDYPTCYITQESRGYNFKIYEKRMPKCLLKEVKIGEDPFPEKPNRNYKVYIPKPVKDYYY